MNKQQKATVVEQLKESFSNSAHFYIADSSELSVAEVNALRELCFNKGVKLQVAKNTLVKRALESQDGEYAELMDILKGPTSIMFSEVANMPAKVIKEFRKGHDKPILKAAMIDADVFIGDEYVETLAALKSKEELIGEIISLLQSPAKNVISALKSSGGKLAGIVKTLSEKSES